MRKQNLRNKLALHTECTSLQKRSYTTYYIMTYTKYSTRNGLEMGKGKEHLLGSVECTELWGTELVEWSCCASAIQLIKLSCYQPYVSEEQKYKVQLFVMRATFFYKNQSNALPILRRALKHNTHIIGSAIRPTEGIPFSENVTLSFQHLQVSEALHPQHLPWSAKR